MYGGLYVIDTGKLKECLASVSKSETRISSTKRVYCILWEKFIVICCLELHPTSGIGFFLI